MEGTTIDWTSVLIAMLSIGTFGGTWAYFTTRARLASKEKIESQKREDEREDAITTKWRDIVAEIQTQRISDRQLMQAQVAAVDNDLQQTKASLKMSNEAVRHLTSELHKTQNDLKYALKKINEQAKALKIERKRVSLLKEQVYELGGRPVTGPLDQGTEKE